MAVAAVRPVDARNTLRMIAPPIYQAERIACPDRFANASKQTSKMTPAQRLGIQYENKVKRALQSMASQIGDSHVEENPFFRFRDSIGVGICSPDAIFWVGDLFAIIVEVKYTWTPLAQIKLTRLYYQVVNHILAPRILRTLVVCKNLVPHAPAPIASIFDGTNLSSVNSPVYHWLGQGALKW